MQRVRVGVTGLAAVVLVVALATAIASGVKRSANDNARVDVPSVVATIEPANATDAATEPLAQLGVAPDAKEVSVPPAKAR